MSSTHITAPTQFIEANGVRYAYRRFGGEQGVPLVFLQHFRGGMDNWDPLITDGLAQGRPVILVNYAGVASSGGEPATTVDGMADGIADLIQALSFPCAVDVLGFSIGGFVAQSLAHRYPQFVRRLVLVGTGPRNGDRSQDSKVLQVAASPVPSMDDFLYLFVAPTEKSQSAGRAFWERCHRRADQDPASSVEVMKAQGAAIAEWSAPHGERYAYLKEIGRQRPQRHHGAEHQLIHVAAAYSQRAAHPVPGLWSWLAIPVPRTVRRPDRSFPRWTTGCLTSRLPPLIFPNHFWI